MHKPTLLYVRQVILLHVLIGLILLGITGCSPQSDVKRTMNAIPKEHLDRIENLFMQLVTNSSAAYTLFGPKPMSIEGYTDNALAMTPHEIHFPNETLIFKHGWDSWEKFQDHFPSQVYALKRVPFYDHPSYWHIYVINKPATLTVLRKHIDTFNTTLGTHYTAEELWSRMDASDIFFHSVVEHSSLLGILLGYGKENAEAFTRRAEICLHLNRFSTPPFQLNHEWKRLSPESQRFVQLYTANISPVSSVPEPMKPKPGFDSLADELNAICSHICFFELEGAHPFLERYGQPVFMTLKGEPETDEWRQVYTKTRQHVVHLFKEKPFLETVFTQWMR